MLKPPVTDAGSTTSCVRSVGAILVSMRVPYRHTQPTKLGGYMASQPHVRIEVSWVFAGIAEEGPCFLSRAPVISHRPS